MKLTEFEQEILDRIVRIESRMVQLGDHVGANLRSKQKIDVVLSQTGTVVVIDSLDVSASRIYTELAAKRVRTGEPVPVFHKNRLVMTLYP